MLQRERISTAVEASYQRLTGALRKFRWQILAIIFIAIIQIILTRSMFSGGLLAYSDLYPVFPGSNNGQGLIIYLSSWNPGSLGSPSAQPGEYAILSGLSLLGIPPIYIQVGVIESFLFVGAFCTYLLSDRFVSHKSLVLLAPLFFLLTPVMFDGIFDSSANLPLFCLVPAITILGLDLSEKPTLRRIGLLASALGAGFAFVTFGPIFVIPILFAIVASRWIASDFRFPVVGSISIAASFGIGLVLNAPFYFENFSYFTGQGVAGVYSPASAIASTSYSWSTRQIYYPESDRVYTRDTRTISVPLIPDCSSSSSPWDWWRSSTLGTARKLLDGLDLLPCLKVWVGSPSPILVRRTACFARFPTYSCSTTLKFFTCTLPYHSQSYYRFQLKWSGPVRFGKVSRSRDREGGQVEQSSAASRACGGEVGLLTPVRGGS